MTFEIATVLGILLVALVLFVTEWIRMDVVALLVLGGLALAGIVTPVEALAGFGNPAVVTVWAMFMLSGALTHTGVARVIGAQVLRLVGTTETRMVAVIMLTSGAMSAIMNNIGVAALLLPVVMDVARRVGRPPSRLLMPLAYGTLLGGLTTMIGTPPNLLISEALSENGLEPFSLFDFTPIGLTVMLTGIAFVALVGRHVLPTRDIARESSSRGPEDLTGEYALDERLLLMRLGAESPLAGMSLAECRLGTATGLNVLAVSRGRRRYPAPPAGFTLEGGDRLLVGGRLDRFEELRAWRELIVEEEDLKLDRLMSDDVGIVEVRLPESSSIVGRSLGSADFRRRFGVIVLALLRGGTARHTNLATVTLEAGDRLLMQGRRESLERIQGQADFAALARATPADELTELYGLRQRIFAIHLPADSVLVGRSFEETRLGDALGLGVLGIEREGRTLLEFGAGERLQAGDRLLVRGPRQGIDVFRGLQQLEIAERQPEHLDALEFEGAGLGEVILTPRSKLAGRTARELSFRERYGLQILAILREGTAMRSNLREATLRFGDALLLYGPREKLRLLEDDRDFVMLTGTGERELATARAPLAALIMTAVIVPVLLGWLPISIASVLGVAAMIITACLPLDEIYRVVEWKSIFLIAGMLPLGTAMQQTGAASYIAEHVLQITSPFGPWGVIGGLYLITAMATMVVPTAALVVLMAPIVLKATQETGISPHAAMMAVAMAASASFTSPISHPANILVMGPGGYRFTDYLKLGVPLSILVMIVVMTVLPFFWPL